MKLRILISCDCFPTDRLFSLEGWFKFQQSDDIKRISEGLFERKSPCALCNHKITFRLAEVVK